MPRCFSSICNLVILTSTIFILSYSHLTHTALKFLYKIQLSFFCFLLFPCISLFLCYCFFCTRLNIYIYIYIFIYNRQQRLLQRKTTEYRAVRWRPFAPSFSCLENHRVNLPGQMAHQASSGMGRTSLSLGLSLQLPLLLPLIPSFFYFFNI